MLAKKYEYEIDAGQELYALSFTAIGGSFFPTFPTSIGLGRTMVGVESGVKTQVATFFSCLFVLSVSLYFGRFLETLPMCVLSAIIVIALKSMLWKLRDLKGIWKLSKIDCVSLSSKRELNSFFIYSKLHFNYIFSVHLDGCFLCHSTC